METSFHLIKGHNSGIILVRNIKIKINLYFIHLNIIKKCKLNRYQKQKPNKKKLFTLD
jgi:hypothetical protein